MSAERNYVETYRGNGGCSMMLRNFPILAVASVAFAGQTITAAADPVALTSGILFDERTLTLVGQRFPIGLPVVISYTARASDHAYPVDTHRYLL